MAYPENINTHDPMSPEYREPEVDPWDEERANHTEALKATINKLREQLEYAKSLNMRISYDFAFAGLEDLESDL